MPEHTNPLTPDQPDMTNTPAIVRSVFAHGYMVGMYEASKLVKSFESQIGLSLSLDVRTMLVSHAERGCEVHDRIMNTPPDRTEAANEQDACGGQM